ncbi:MAG: hypothetical protein Q7K33_01690 [Candidatus Berkelbacteria bacterium]|nr:hypothetical protein [Candidatus Berkelbacteria bacterium]
MHLVIWSAGSFIVGWGASNWYRAYRDVKQMILGPSQIIKPMFTTVAGGALLAVSFAFK